MIFTSVWTLLALLYLALAPRFFSSVAHVMAIFALDALTMLFWFAGFIALAVFRSALEVVANDIYTHGCSALFDVCPTLEAAVVFGAFEWYVKTSRNTVWRRGSWDIRSPCALATSLVPHAVYILG